MEDTKITYGLLGALSLIVFALGGTIFLTEDQLDDAYICSVNQNVVLGIDHLSSTSKTAYWFDELGEQQSKVCRNGFWLDLRQYAKDNNIDINILLQDINDIFPNSNNFRFQYSCSSKECVVIDN